MNDFLFTIVYFKDGAFFMISANCFKSRSSAERVAGAFCRCRENDGRKWTYNIEKLGVH